MIYYETGDLYKGKLKQGKRHGAGYYYDRAGKKTYNGQFMNDNRHGQGTLCTEEDSAQNMYIFDGEWFEGYRNGMGQEITSKGKYTGDWLEDHRHGQGISVDEAGNMYEGHFMFGKKHGRGKLTKCAAKPCPTDDQATSEDARNSNVSASSSLPQESS